MKKWVILLAVLFLISVAVPCSAEQIVVQDQGTVKSIFFVVGSPYYYVNGKQQQMDVEPYIKNDRTFVPMRYLANAVGITNENIFWDDKTRKATFNTNAVTVSMIIGRPAVYINGQANSIDVSPEISKDRTCLPARYFMESLGYEVDWDNQYRVVICWPKGEQKPVIPDRVKIDALQPTEPTGSSLSAKDVERMRCYAAVKWPWIPKMAVWGSAGTASNKPAEYFKAFVDNTIGKQLQPNQRFVYDLNTACVVDGRIRIFGVLITEYSDKVVEQDVYLHGGYNCAYTDDGLKPGWYLIEKVPLGSERVFPRG